MTWERVIAGAGASAIACVLAATGQYEKATYIAIALVAFFTGEINGKRNQKT